jgi:amino acid permease
MVGGAMLTFPIQFRNAGLITSVIVLAISALISYKTCRIYAIHLSKKDTDVDDTIKRIMGSKWLKWFRYITGFYLVLLNMIYIDLIVDQLYDVIFYIFNHTGHKEWVAPKNST